MISETLFNAENITANSSQLAQLQALFPHCFDANGQFLLEKFQAEIAAQIDISREFYSLNWLGKSYARLLRNLPPETFIAEDPEHNAKPENAHSQNLLIKGDNLEVLKHLKHAYTGAVKMIYIDPPYNTGSDGFVYQDDRKFTPEQLSELANISVDEAVRILAFTDKGSNSHSAWLTFMYPRLYIARDLLREDGVIFISIDDNEAAQLKLLCDEVFGEGNFRNSFIARRHDKNLNRQFIDAGLKTLNVGFETILVYSKSNIFDFNAIFKDASEERATQGYWKGFWNAANRPTMRYPLLGVNPTEGQWKWKETVSREAVENYIEYEKSFSEKMTLEEYWEKTGKTKKFIRRNKNGKGKNLGVEHWIEPSSGILRNTNLLDILVTSSMVEFKNIFDFPKNPELLKILLNMGTDKNDLVMDFFAGSGTTAHAVMQLNAEGGGNRQFILVQLPEATDEKSEAYKAGYKTIFDITQARIEKAAAKIQAENPHASGDFGFKIYQTVENFRRHTDADFDLNQPDLLLANDLSESQYHTLLTTWALYDGATLTTPITPVQIGNYTAHLCEKRLYLLAPDFQSANVLALIHKIDNDPDFNPNRVVVFGENMASAVQMELDQAIKSYTNKKSIALELVIRV